MSRSFQVVLAFSVQPSGSHSKARIVPFQWKTLLTSWWYRLLRMSRSFQVVPAVSMQPALLPSQGNAQRLLLRLDLHSAQARPHCACALPSC